jgi:hypothetical protein
VLSHHKQPASEYDDPVHQELCSAYTFLRSHSQASTR